MNNWQQYPQKIDNWDLGIDYVMFIDENGNSENIQSIVKKIFNKQEISVDEKYFTITGCIFERSKYSMMRNSVRKLKDKYWTNGFYYDTKHCENRYVCFHSRDIRKHDGAFNDKLIDFKSFINDLTTVLESIDCKIISITIDLEKYIRQNYLDNIYEKAFDLLLERYIYATKNNKKGIIMLESRGKKEDKILLNHIIEIINRKGQKFIPSSELKEKIVGVYFNPKWYSGHTSTFAGLEIADLYSYPIHQFIKYNKENPAFSVIKTKIDGYPSINKKGIKIFP